MNPTIQKMQQDLELFRASKMGGASTSTEPVSQETQTPAPVMPSQPDAPQTGIGADLQAFREQKRMGTTTPQTAPASEGNLLATMAKGIFGAPATMIARPFQATAAVGAKVLGKDLTNEEIDTATAKIPVLGSLIAPTPKGYSDLKKEVGRGIQTVALGTGAPIAGGAAFGVGTSLEQGNDLLSAETAFNAATGGAAGKVLQWVGKPIFNATGKVVGTITPQMIKDAAAGGAQSVQKFMAQHNLLGGVAAKPSQAIATGLQKVDDAIETGVKKTFSAVGTGVKNQYPNIRPSATNYFQDKNKSDILRPTTVNESKYAKATDVYNNAKKRGIDIDQVATDRGIIHDKYAQGGTYNTFDEVENLREGNYRDGNRYLRPALAEAEAGVQRVSVPEIKKAMLKAIDEISDSGMTPKDQQWMRNQIERDFAEASAASSKYKDGYTLTNLHDNRIAYQKNGKYKRDGSALENRPATLARLQGEVFSKVLDDVIPEGLPAKEFRREMEKNFVLANYLDELHGKAVPAGITKKAVRLFGKAITATVGGKIGGFPGAILGAQYGDMLFSTFQTLPNPVKMKILESVKTESPAVYKQLLDYIQKQGSDKANRLLLPASSTVKEPSPTLFGTKKGTITPNRQEASDMASVESGKTKLPKTSAMYKQKVKEIQDRLEPYFTPQEMKVIEMGSKPKTKSNGLPTANGLPNVYANPDDLSLSLQTRLEKYLSPDEMEIIDWGPKPKKKLFNGPTIR